MVLLLMIAAGAATLTPPRPIEPSGWIKQEDYPAASVPAAQRGYFLAHITTSSSGTPLHCEPVRSSAFARSICAAVMQRARFDPALDRNGQATTGLYLHRVTFRFPGKNLPPAPPKYVMALTFDRLPSRSPDPADIHVALEVSADGRIAGCTPLRSRQRRDDGQLGTIACSQMTQGYKPPIAEDGQGRALASVQSALVRFQTPRSAKK